MNRQLSMKEDLLEPFPTRRGSMMIDTEISLSSLFQKLGGHRRAKNESNKSLFNRSSSSNQTSATYLFHDSASVSLDITTGNDQSETTSNIDKSASRLDPISVASIVSDDDEFRRFQQGLRDSRMVTGFATQQIIKQHVDSQARTILAKRKQDPELNKVKNFAAMANTDKPLLQCQQSQRSLTRGLCNISQSFRKSCRQEIVNTSSCQ